jgi:hypothetical protein
MTVTMTTSEPDFELAELTAAGIANGGNFDSMSTIEQLPEVSVPVGSLVPGCYLRQEGTDAAHVRLLADAADAASLPSILVQKTGSRIIDGMHRIEVAKLRGEWNIRARIVDCTDSEALVLAVKANTLHGLPLSRADRVSGAKRILSSHADWSDRAVAQITGLSAKAIASIRNTTAADAQFLGKRLGRDGKRRPVVPVEGRRRAAEYILAHPDASLRQVARETDVSLGTVHDVKDKIRRGEDCLPGPWRPWRLVRCPPRRLRHRYGRSTPRWRHVTPSGSPGRPSRPRWPAILPFGTPKPAVPSCAGCPGIRCRALSGRSSSTRSRRTGSKRSPGSRSA